MDEPRSGPVAEDSTVVQASAPSTPRRMPRSSRPPRPSGLGYQVGLVTIVVPAKNEAGTIGGTLRRLPVSTLKTMGFEVETVVLDGRSRDATARIAREAGATVVIDRSDGKAMAMRDARHTFRGEFVVMIDADGTYAADAIPTVVSRLAWGECDIVMGARKPVRSNAMSTSHRIGNFMLSTAARSLYLKSCPDLCTGLWGFRREALRSIPLRSRRFGLEAELFAAASRLGLRICHVKTDYLPRTHGEAKIRAGPDGMRIAWRLLRTRFAALDAPAGGDAAVPVPLAEVPK